MNLPLSDWIAPTGIRAVDENAHATKIPHEVFADVELSLVAKGLYGELLSYQGRPLDPYAGALDDPRDLVAAIEELIAAGLVVRMER